MPLMSYREYARHRGCTLKAVQKAIGEPDGKGGRDGRIGASLVAITGSKHAKIDSEKADALWQLNTDESKRSLFFEPEESAAQAKQPAAEAEDDPLENTADPELVAAKKELYMSRAATARTQEENARLDLEERKRQLISLAEATQLSYTALRTLRDALRNIGARISAQVSAISDPFECEQIINAEIDAALSSITPEKLLADQNDDGDEDGGDD